MQQYANWVRLHPGLQDETAGRGVEARLHDPLWLLGRQWQMQEFCHDGGSAPVQVCIEGDCQRITGLTPAAQPGQMLPLPQSVNANAMPITMRAEHEYSALDAASRFERLRIRFEAGLQFSRMLRAANLGHRLPQWIYSYAFDGSFWRELGAADDNVSTSWLRLMDGRCLDGARLLAYTGPQKLGAGGVQLPLTPEESIEIDVFNKWRASVSSDFAPVPKTVDNWNKQRLEHSFKVHLGKGGGALNLDVPEYFGDDLNWYHFEQLPSTTGVLAPIKHTAYRIPTPLEFAGMPNPRFWTFEDGSSNFDAFEALSERNQGGAAPSITTDMVVDFALSYSDDWFLIPFRLPVWCTFQTLKFAITDVFGDSAIAAKPGGRWNMFKMDADAKAFTNGLSELFIVAGSSQANVAPVHEEVHLLRDEITNVAFAIERLIPNAASAAYEIEQQATSGTINKPSIDLRWTWTLATAVPPPNWFPLLPSAPGMLTVGALWTAPDVVPHSVVIQQMKGVSGLHSEEIPLEGIRVSRRWKSARGIDGSLHFWIARVKTPGRQEVPPELRFDLVEFAAR